MAWCPPFIASFDLLDIVTSALVIIRAEILVYY